MATQRDIAALLTSDQPDATVHGNSAVSQYRLRISRDAQILWLACTRERPNAGKCLDPLMPLDKENANFKQEDQPVCNAHSGITVESLCNFHPTSNCCCFLRGLLIGDLTPEWLVGEHLNQHRMFEGALATSLLTLTTETKEKTGGGLQASWTERGSA